MIIKRIGVQTNALKPLSAEPKIATKIKRNEETTNQSANHFLKINKYIISTANAAPVIIHVTNLSLAEKEKSGIEQKANPSNIIIAIPILFFAFSVLNLEADLIIFT